MIGDRRDNDIAPAKSESMRAVLIQWPNCRSKGWNPEDPSGAGVSRLVRPHSAVFGRAGRAGTGCDGSDVARPLGCRQLAERNGLERFPSRRSGPVGNCR